MYLQQIILLRKHVSTEADKGLKMTMFDRNILPEKINLLKIHKQKVLLTILIPLYVRRSNLTL